MIAELDGKDIGTHTSHIAPAQVWHSSQAQTNPKNEMKPRTGPAQDQHSSGQTQAQTRRSTRPANLLHSSMPQQSVSKAGQLPPTCLDLAAALLQPTDCNEDVVQKGHSTAASAVNEMHDDKYVTHRSQCTIPWQHCRRHWEPWFGALLWC